eukprot:snap_masked-scaffold_36-processed-gene-1.33-mRNA-1 protein AED:0.65 eAED:1.00 QI:0/-1/0/1/-1/1/1/0/80
MQPGNKVLLEWQTKSTGLVAREVPYVVIVRDVKSSQCPESEEDQCLQLFGVSCDPFCFCTLLLFLTGLFVLLIALSNTEF